MSRHRTRHGIEERGPTTTTLEFVVGFVERCIAAGASVGALSGHVFVVFTSKGRFGAFFAEDAELFCARRKVEVRTSSRGRP